MPHVIELFLGSMANTGELQCAGAVGEQPLDMDSRLFPSPPIPSVNAVLSWRIGWDERRRAKRRRWAPRPAIVGVTTGNGLRSTPRFDRSKDRFPDSFWGCKNVCLRKLLFFRRNSWSRARRLSDSRPNYGFRLDRLLKSAYSWQEHLRCCGTTEFGQTRGERRGIVSVESPLCAPNVRNAPGQAIKLPTYGA